MGERKQNTHVCIVKYKKQLSIHITGTEQRSPKIAEHIPHKPQSGGGGVDDVLRYFA